MSAKESIGFNGLGPMGHGMAANLLKAGHPLAVKGSRSRAPVEDLITQGEAEAASPRWDGGRLRHDPSLQRW